MSNHTSAVEDRVDAGAALWADALVVDGLSVNAQNWKLQLSVGVTAGNVTLASANSTFHDMLKRMDPYLMLLSLYPEEVLLVRTTQDIVRAKQEGKFGLIFGWQNGSPLGDDPMFVRVAHLMGVRIIQITYNERNNIGDGCLEPENRGLTAFGRQVVQEMNRLGILVDLSHVGDRTCAEAIELSTLPCVFSHANPRSLAASPRNKPDDLLKAIAAKGGLVGLSPYAAFCQIDTGRFPTADDFYRIVEYAIDLVGIDHVSFGTDMPEGRDHLSYEIVMRQRYPEVSKGFTHNQRHATGFERLEGLRDIPNQLLRRGYSDEDVRKFIGGNLLRVFAQVWDK